MLTYDFEVKGTAAGEQEWTTTGTVETQNAGEFPQMLNLALMQSFQNLTQGKAVFGKPGVGCRGPYGVTSFLIVKRKV